MADNFTESLRKTTALTPDDLQDAVLRATSFGQAGVAVAQAKAPIVPPAPTIVISEAKLDAKPAAGTTVQATSGQGDPTAGTAPANTIQIYCNFNAGPTLVEFVASIP